jgi:probable O-glycosylation ligase (exosortase A-associated)
MIALLAPASWTDRMQTIKSADEDSSFMGRVEAWQVSSEIAISNPVFGGGFHAVQVQTVWDQFKGKGGLLSFIDTGMTSARARSAHSIYFEVLGDRGFVGLFLFLAILMRAIVNIVYIRSVVIDRSVEFGWAGDLSRTLMVVIVIYIFGGAALNIAYYEILYATIMLTEVLRREVSV